MTDAQFTELLARLDNFQLMVFIALCLVLMGIGWLNGGQR
ncbi:conserved hypothetical protein [Vibrio aestuarianus]|nr:conserved hypothetical protein [Vibrio aestuarianus]